MTDFQHPLTTEGGVPSPDARAAFAQDAGPASCALCGSAIPPGTERRVDQHLACEACAEQVAAELQAEQSQPQKLPLVTVGALAGAMVGAAAWAALAIFGNIEFGLVAVAVGFLAGVGAKFAAGKARGQSFQIATAASAAVGLLAGKYFTFAHYMAEAMAARGLEVMIWSPDLIAAFAGALGGMLSPFDALWFFLALSSAWKALAPSAVDVR